MLRIYQHLGSLDDQERVTAWVFRIARNAITDHYRRNGRRREVLAAELGPVADLSADAWLNDLVKQCCDVTTDSRGKLVDFSPACRRLRPPAPV